MSLSKSVVLGAVLRVSVLDKIGRDWPTDICGQHLLRPWNTRWFLEPRAAVVETAGGHGYLCHGHCLAVSNS